MMIVFLEEKSILSMRSVSFLLIFHVSLTCNCIFVFHGTSLSRRVASSPPKVPIALPSEQIIIGRRTISHVKPIFGLERARSNRSSEKRNSSSDSHHQEDTILTKFGIESLNVEMKEDRKVEASRANNSKLSRKQASTNNGDHSLPGALINQHNSDTTSFDLLDQPDIEEIYCNGTSFSATIVLPKSFVIEPEFNDLVEAGSTGSGRSSAAGTVSSACAIKQINYRLYPTYKIVANNFGLCGVTKSWLDESFLMQQQQQPSLSLAIAPHEQPTEQPKVGGHASWVRLRSHRHSHGDRATAAAAAIEESKETGEEASSKQVLLLNIRFPVIKLLKTNEDTYATLVCSPETDNNRYDGAASDDFRSIITSGGGANSGNIGRISYTERSDDRDYQERDDADSAIGNTDSDRGGSSGGGSNTNNDERDSETDIVYGGSQEQGMNNEFSRHVRTTTTATATQQKQLRQRQRQQQPTRKQQRRQQSVIERRPPEVNDIKDDTVDEPIVEESRRRHSLRVGAAVEAPPSQLVFRHIHADSPSSSPPPTTIATTTPTALVQTSAVAATTTEANESGSSRKIATATVASAAATIVPLTTLVSTSQQPATPKTNRVIADGITQTSGSNGKDILPIVTSQPQLERQTSTNRPDLSVMKGGAGDAAISRGRQNDAVVWFGDKSWPQQTPKQQQSASLTLLTNKSLQRDRQHVTKFVDGINRAQLVVPSTPVTTPSANRRQRKEELLEAQQKLASPPIGSDNQLGLVVATLFGSLIIILLIVTIILGNLFAIL